MYSDSLDGIHTTPPALGGNIPDWWWGSKVPIKVKDNPDYRKVFALPSPDETRSQIREMELEIQRLDNLRALNKTNSKGNRKWESLGPREFTLTYSPKWFDDATARNHFHVALERLTKYYKTEWKQFRAVGEVGSNGMSHVHCFYELEAGKKITDKNFKRAYQWWDTSIKHGKTGHQGGHHASVVDVPGFRAYIEKDIDSTAWMNLSLEDLF